MNSLKPISSIKRVKLLLALFGVTIAFLLLEMLALTRLVDYRAVFHTEDPTPWGHPSNRLDPALIHIRKPNIVLDGVQPSGDIGFYYDIPEPTSYPYHATYDQDGFRNETDLSSAPIVVLGDSFVESLLTSSSEHFITLTSKALQLPIRNLGQLWYGPQQELEVLRRYTIPHQPKIVVWAFFEGNDLTDYLRYERMMHTWPALQSKLESYVDRSLLKNSLRAIRRKLQGEITKSPADFALCSRSQKQRVPLYFYYDEIYRSSPIEHALLETKRIIEQAASETRSIGAKFMFVFIPSKSRVYRPLCNPDSPQPVNGWLEHELRTLITAKIPEATYMDLTPALQEAARSASPLLYFVDDTHWSTAGHAVVADEISRALKVLIQSSLN
ncbi:MAG: hypothetical protein KDD60_07130 [Bdellovibrionales bacterium]|nr:hypothetical protein [Bdellovibrionales bacterium]